MEAYDLGPTTFVTTDVAPFRRVTKRIFTPSALIVTDPGHSADLSGFGFSLGSCGVQRHLFFFFLFCLSLNHPSSLCIQMSWLHGPSTLAVRPPSSTPLVVFCVDSALSLQFVIKLSCFKSWLILLILCLSSWIISIIFKSSFGFILTARHSAVTRLDLTFLVVFSQLTTVSASCQRSVRVSSTCMVASESSPPSTTPTRL